MMHPLFDQMSLKYTNVVFIRVDSDQNRDLAGQYSVSGLPTFVLVFHGDEVDRVVGADPNALESKIQQYANSAATFKGTGMSLGGSGVRDAQSIREMRLKNFKDVKILGSQMAGKVSKMLDRVKSRFCEEVAPETSSQVFRLWFHCREADAAIRDNLLTMGFSASNVEKVFVRWKTDHQTLKECKSRDLADLVAYITTLPESEEGNEPTEQQSHPGVVCDGNECHFVNPQPEKSFDERMEETRRRIQQKKVEKEEAEKKAAIQREKERIERGKAMQSTKEEFEAMQRKRELERQRQEKIAEEVNVVNESEEQNEKKRQLELWRAEHGLPAVQPQEYVGRLRIGRKWLRRHQKKRQSFQLNQWLFNVLIMQVPLRCVLYK